MGESIIRKNADGIEVTALSSTINIQTVKLIIHFLLEMVRVLEKT